MSVFDNGGEMQFQVGSVNSAKVTNNGIGCSNLVAQSGMQAQRLGLGGADASGGFNLYCKGQPFQSAAVFETYPGAAASGIGIAVLSNTYAIIFQRDNVNVGSVSVDTTNTYFNTASDRRLKSDIQDLTDTGSIIDALKPRSFTWKLNGKQDRGFIADEIQEVVPNAAEGQPDAVDADGNPIYQGVDASTPEMIAIVVAELQSLRKRVAAAETKIDAQAAEITALKGTK
jgi:hypothetical protein